MAVKYIATLGPKGWITDGYAILDTVMAWAYASDASQSLFFSGDVFSIAKVVHTDHNGRIESKAAALQEGLTTYLGRFFDNVEVKVTVEDIQFKDYHLKGELILRAVMTDHTGKELQLSEVMTNKGSVARKVLDYIPE